MNIQNIKEIIYILKLMKNITKNHYNRIQFSPSSINPIKFVHSLKQNFKQVNEDEIVDPFELAQSEYKNDTDFIISYVVQKTFDCRTEFDLFMIFTHILLPHFKTVTLPQCGHLHGLENGIIFLPHLQM